MRSATHYVELSARLAKLWPGRNQTAKTETGTDVLHSRLARAVFSHVAGLAAISAITEIYRHEPWANVTTVGFTFLLAILVAAIIGGFSTSLVMSVAATLCYDYFFIPPVNTWNITDPRDWVALFAFLLTAAIGSTLSVAARRQTRRAESQREEAIELYELSQGLLSAPDSLALCNAIPQHLTDSFQTEGAALLLSEDQTVFYSAGASHLFDAAELKASLSEKTVKVNRQHHLYFVPLRLGMRVLGVIGIAGRELSFETLESIGPLITIAIERARAIEQVGKIEALRESEKLKAALLDAITHEFRTPLTAMKLSVTGMLSDLNFDREQCRELLGMIDEGCDRIDQLVDEVSQMSRLETGDVRLELAPHTVGELIDTAFASYGAALGGRPIERHVANEDVPIRADLAWANKILVHLLMNANLYSIPNGHITIKTETNKGFVFFHISDVGPGIDPSELGRIFEKFYRGKDHRCQIQGTGMGLAIARAIAEAHSGTLTAVSTPGKGSTFTFSLPIDRSLV